MSNAQQEAGPARPTSRSGRAIKASSSAHFVNAGRPADTARAKTGFALEHRVEPVASWGWNPAGRNVVMSLECNSTTSSPRTRRLANSQRRSATQRVRAAILTCSRNHACAGSLVSRGCHAMKYENPLISRGGSNASISRVSATQALVVTAQMVTVGSSLRVHRARPMAQGHRRRPVRTRSDPDGPES